MANLRTWYTCCAFIFICTLCICTPHVCQEDESEPRSVELDIFFRTNTYNERKAESGYYTKHLTGALETLNLRCTVQLVRRLDIFGLISGNEARITFIITFPIELQEHVIVSSLRQLIESTENPSVLRKIGMRSVKHITVLKFLPKKNVVLTIGWYALFAVTAVDLMLVGTVCLRRPSRRDRRKNKFKAEDLHSVGAGDLERVQNETEAMDNNAQMQKLIVRLGEEDARADVVNRESRAEPGDFHEWVELNSKDWKLPATREREALRRQEERMKEETKRDFTRTKRDEFPHLDVQSFQSFLNDNLAIPSRCKNPN